MIKLKKLNSLFLCFAILFVSLFTSTQKVNAEIIKIGVIDEPGVNKIGVVLREDASKKSKKIITVWSGDVLTIIDSKRDISGENYTWYHGSFVKNSTTYTGYIREDMIKISEYNTDPTFEQQLTDFPESYRTALIQLHAMYPNWVFRADKLTITFDDAVAEQELYSRKQVSSSYVSWRSMEKGYYDWPTGTWQNVSNGGWYGASKEVIAYYMDPRNFLNANDIYMYMVQTDDSNNSSVSDMEKVLSNTFLLNGYNDANDTAYGGSYINVIFDAAKKSGINPFVLGATLRQEQGAEGTSALISGNPFTYDNITYQGLYNFFNFQASGKTKDLVIKNGLSFAQTKGWTTRSKAIVEGASLYRTQYIDAGQNTYFYKNFNLVNRGNFPHQYAQNVQDSYSSAQSLKKVYSDKYSQQLTFRIPVYKDNSLPSEISPFPVQNQSKNNYYFNNISVGGLTPSFSRYNYEYSLSVGTDTSIYVELPEGASFNSQKSYSLNVGENLVYLNVKAETGYTRNYLIHVNAVNPCTLSITTDSASHTQNVVKGDTNGDNLVTLSDLANVRLYLLEKINLQGNNYIGADTNGDNKVTLSDLANIRLHLLGQKSLN